MNSPPCHAALVPIPGSNLFSIDNAMLPAGATFMPTGGQQKRSLSINRSASSSAAKPPQQISNQAGEQARREFKAKLERFVAAFGEKRGSEYAAQGLTFEQAEAEHKQLVAAVRRCGEIWAAEDAQKAADQAKVKQLTNAMGGNGNLARFAASIKLPAQKAK